MIFYLVTREHAYTMAWFLESWGKSLANRITIMPYDELVAGKPLPRDSSFIFSDLDRLPIEARSILGPFHADLVATFGAAHVLNDPLRSLLRFDLLRVLHERGINRFAASRAPEGVVPPRFPVFVRDERAFVSSPPMVFKTAAQYAAVMRSLDAPGVPPEHRIAVEYCDTADEKGIYRKYGVFVAGGAIVARHLFFSRSWFVKDADLAEPAMLAEELAFVETNPHAEILREVFRLSGIAYGRVDYSLLDGRPQIWEINTNPILTPRTDKFPERRSVHRHFVDEIAAAFVAIDARPVKSASQVLIRKMRPDDLDRVTTILAGWNMAPTPASVTLPDPELSAIPIDTTFVALINGSIVGVASYLLLGNDRGQTLVLAVDPANRKAGIGTRLQSARLSEMKALGIATVRTDADRPEAIEWYVQKFGCRVTGSKPKKHPFGLLGVDHWTVLELDLRNWTSKSL